MPTRLIFSFTTKVARNMYKSDDRNGFARHLLEPLVEAEVQNRNSIEGYSDDDAEERLFALLEAASEKDAA